MSKETPTPTCAACPIRSESLRRCVTAAGRHPDNCPTIHKQELGEEALACYRDPESLRLARVAGKTEGDGYVQKPDGSVRGSRSRIEELVHFCAQMGYTKIGLLFCIGLRHEAAVVHKILETNGFTVVSAVCKVGRVSKDALEIDNPLDDPMCNPILQAKLVNEAGVDFNVFMGLCIGHDTLLFKHVEAPVTILAVKDRVLGHNPLAAIYQYDSYYAFLQKPLLPVQEK